MSPEDLDDIMRQAVGRATAELAEHRASELGLISLKSAELGTGFFLTTTFSNPRLPESKARAILIIACGDLPDDLMTSLVTHAKGTLQDLLHGNPDIRQIHRNESPDDE